MTDDDGGDGGGTAKHPVLVRRVLRRDGSESVGFHVYCTERSHALDLDACRECAVCDGIVAADDGTAEVRCRPRTSPPEAPGDLMREAITCVEEDVPSSQITPLFLERGIETVTIDEITREAGVAKGSFYRYFDDKKQIYLEVTRRHMAALYHQVMDRLTPERFAGKEARATITETVNILFDQVNRHPTMHRVFLEMSLRDDDVMALRRAFDAISHEQLTRLIAAICPARSRGSSPAATPESAASAAASASRAAPSPRRSATTRPPNARPSPRRPTPRATPSPGAS